MKKENIKMINNQMKTLAKEIEGILDIAERAQVRAKYIELLFDISVSGALEDSGCSCGGNCGKEAIKEDLPKPESETVEEEQEVEPVEDDALDESEEVEQAKQPEEDDPLNDSEEVEQDTAEDEKLLYETEDGDILDVTEIYNKVTDVEDPETRLQVAGYITEYDECIEEYNSLSMLTSSVSKIYLAYCIKYYGLDNINECVARLTENQITDLFEYINDNNVDGFTQYVDQTFDEE